MVWPRRHALTWTLEEAKSFWARRHALACALGSVESLWPCRHAYTRCGRPAGAKRDFPQAPRVRSAAVDAPQGACIGRALVTTRGLLVLLLLRTPKATRSWSQNTKSCPSLASISKQQRAQVLAAGTALLCRGRIRTGGTPAQHAGFCGNGA